MTLQFNQAIAEPSNFYMGNTVKPLFTGNDSLIMALEHMSTFCTRHNVCTRIKTPQLGLVAGVSILLWLYCMCLPYIPRPPTPH